MYITKYYQTGNLARPHAIIYTTPAMAGVRIRCHVAGSMYTETCCLSIFRLIIIIYCAQVVNLSGNNELDGDTHHIFFELAP